MPKNVLLATKQYSGSCLKT